MALRLTLGGVLLTQEMIRGSHGLTCVSRARPACFWYGVPSLPTSRPSRKLPL